MFGRLPACVSRFYIPVLSLAALLAAGPAAADEQRVARLGLAISAMVSSLSPDYINRGIEDINRLAERDGIASIGAMNASPFFQAEGRFFVSDRIVAVAGVGKIRKTSQLEILPNADTQVLQQARISGIPRHLGLDYYFTPYTRGDFTVRPFVGGGFMDVVEARSKLGYQVINSDTLLSGGFVRAKGEGPGFYLEGGTHFMLPSRYSFIVNVHYRRVKATELRYETADGEVLPDIVLDEDGKPAKLDFSGFGLRFAVNMNLWNRF